MSNFQLTAFRGHSPFAVLLHRLGAVLLWTVIVFAVVFLLGAFARTPNRSALPAELQQASKDATVVNDGSVNTPNPSKAPWYYLSLQEMLVYFDPWFAGVILPALIIIGLVTVPIAGALFFAIFFWRLRKASAGSVRLPNSDFRLPN